MTSEQIKECRRMAGENTFDFGVRFLHSSRTIENWEQGRAKPDKFVTLAIQKLYDRLKKKRNNSD